MSTSGTNNFSQNCIQVCTLAFQKIGKYGIGRTISNEDMTLAYANLNMMIKTWASDGLHLWAKEEGVLYLNQYTAQYSLGNASTDAMVTLKSDEIITQLNGALTASSTAITVDSTAGMLNGDNIGIVLSDNTIFWTTLTVNTNTTLTLATGISGAASDRTFVYTFTNKAYKPLRIFRDGGRMVKGLASGTATGYTEVAMSYLAYSTYMQMPSKQSYGTAIAFTYKPNISNGTLYLWPKPDDTNYRFEFTYVRTIQDLDSATDDFDFPQEWMEPLVWQLALRLAFDFGMDMKIKTLSPMAQSLYESLKSWDCEVDGVNIYPQYNGED